MLSSVDFHRRSSPPVRTKRSHHCERASRPPVPSPGGVTLDGSTVVITTKRARNERPRPRSEPFDLARCRSCSHTAKSGCWGARPPSQPETRGSTSRGGRFPRNFSCHTQPISIDPGIADTYVLCRWGSTERPATSSPTQTRLLSAPKQEVK